MGPKRMAYDGCKGYLMLLQGACQHATQSGTYTGVAQHG